MAASIKNVGIFCKQKPAISREVLVDLAEWLRRRDYRIFMDRETSALVGGGPSALKKSEIPGCSDLLIVLGGDGTLLSVAHAAHAFDVPILGVNLGSLGFLTEVTLPQLYPALEKVLRGDCVIEERMLLNACLLRGNAKVEAHDVLNDVVINKGALARIVDLEVSVDKKYMTSYRADGLIIATPTGSTAYSLSAGGPIIHPSMQALVLSPICPFSLTNRSIVIPDRSLIQVKLTGREDADVRITLDGQTGCDMKMGDVLEIGKSSSTIKLIQSPGKNYYQLLRQKLHWGRATHEDRSGRDQGGDANDQGG